MKPITDEQYNKRMQKIGRGENPDFWDEFWLFVPIALLLIITALFILRDYGII